jgi:orotidine-5'-phosphate decarboxylase
MTSPVGPSAGAKLIVALDVPNAASALQLAGTLQTRIGMLKIGSELFTAEGPALVRDLAANGHRVFLDLKFHDIPNTVRAAVREASRMGVTMVNVHATGGRKMMRAAADGARDATVGSGGRPPIVIAVTVLTSLAGNDLEEVGLAGSPSDAATRLARLAQESGLDGVVASPHEIAAVRRACGSDFVIVTPGIRPASAASDDQARIATPEAAVELGADYLVIGRPITAAPDPVAATEAIVHEMERALRQSGAGVAP